MISVNTAFLPEEESAGRLVEEPAAPIVRRTPKSTQTHRNPLNSERFSRSQLLETVEKNTLSCR